MKKLLLLCLIILVAMLSGCTEKTNEPVRPNQTLVSPTQTSPTQIQDTIEFETLNKGNSINAGIESPTIFVAGTVDEASEFIQLLENEDVLKRIQDVDYNKTFAIAVFRGSVESSGYGITIQTITHGPDSVKFIVNLTDPSSDLPVSPVMSYPYHIILLPKDKVQIVPGTTWAVYDQGDNELTQITYP